ncbi:MAG: hypothetical protein WBX30_27795, partial [Stellaceae bacterium]
MLTRLPAAVSGGLVRDLPDAVDPQQIVEVEPFIGPALEAKVDRGSIAHLRHRYNSTLDAFPRRRSPVLKALRDQILVKGAFGVDEEDPGVLMKRFFEFVNIIIINSV